MGSTLQRQKQTEIKKRVLSFAAIVGGLYLVFTGSPIIGLLATGLGAFLVRDWFRFRAKNGMRF